ncbi:MAG: alkaline phosphatase [Sedimentisphaerales bacterium]|nr:alkaline phosphatase [Sedimentisphaerales bacterium]
MKKTTKYRILLFALVLLFCGCAGDSAKRNRAALKRRPKNIIVMISDGCGYYHVDAASLYEHGKTGVQAYEHFPVRCAMATYMAGGAYDSTKAWGNFDYAKEDYTDSAAAATAMSCGVKTSKGFIGVDLDKKPLKHIIEKCEELSMATGVVTSVQLSHGTPAGFVAHNESRENYEEIAKDMIYDSAVDVIMGCGHPLYDNDGNLKARPDTYKYVGGKSAWGELTSGVAGGDADGDGVNDPWTLIQTRAEFRALAKGRTPKRVCGVPQIYQTLQEKRSGDEKAEAFAVPLIETVPTLEEITKAALNVLDNDEDGFFLMIEGGAVDWASHDNESGRVIEEEIDFNKAVEAVIDWVNENSDWKKTLVIVTADHECGYMTGPGSGQKEDGPVWQPLINNGKGNQPGIQWHSGDHTNSLIPFYAKGTGCKLFKDAVKSADPVKGKYIDNTDIAKVIFSMLDRGN